MPSRRPSRHASSIATKTAELAFAVPQVVAHRMTRMAIAQPALSDRDRREFTRMVAEKHSAFVQSWQAMAVQTAVANQRLAASFFQALWMPGLRGRTNPVQAVAQLHDAAMGVVATGMAPVHRKAVANAKRLAKTSLR